MIVQFVAYRDTGQRDRSGAQVDEAVVVGSGDAWILSGGKLAKGQWRKSHDGAVTTYTDSSGSPLKLKPGRTWIALPAIGSPATVR